MQTGGWLRNRRVVIGAYLGGIALGAYLISMPLAWQLSGSVGGENDWGLTSLLCTAVFVSLHVVFLLPIRKPDTGAAPRSVLLSLIIAGGLIGALMIALALGVGHAVLTFLDQSGVSDSFLLWSLLGVGVVSWALATPLLIAFTRRGRPESVIQRVAARLFVGTIIEAAAMIPLDVLVRRKEDCVCATGTYLALTICGAVGLFVLGPAALLPILARRRKRWYAGRCEVCGYDMSRTSQLDRCPECGSGWKSSAA
ncbi:hypothetical protein PHYC_03809 [Phycisphaerales bacterium]|nr:hypothetical protein PHYC_03809 [Phycisphaerales bacterium]